MFANLPTSPNLLVTPKLILMVLSQWFTVMNKAVKKLSCLNWSFQWKSNKVTLLCFFFQTVNLVPGLLSTMFSHFCRVFILAILLFNTVFDHSTEVLLCASKLQMCLRSTCKCVLSKPKPVVSHIFGPLTLSSVC